MTSAVLALPADRGMRWCAPIVPRRFNGSTSNIVYASNPLLDLTAQTWLTQVSSPGFPGSTQYVFGHCDSGALNGVRIQSVSSGNVLRFGADSTGTANAPHRSTSAGSVSSGFYTFAATWDGVSLAGSSISVYLASAGRVLSADVGGATADGTGSLQSSTTGQPFVVGNRTGGARTLNGDLYWLATWNRILSLHELRTAQAYGPEAIPLGLVFNWHDGKDFGPYGLVHVAQQDIALGPTSGFVA
jgi:hypothetical protein